MKLEEAIRLLVLDRQHQHKNIDLKLEYEYLVKQGTPLFHEWVINEAKSIRKEKIKKLYEL